MSEDRQKRPYNRQLKPAEDRGNIRLEIVRLCYRHDHESTRVIARARELEAYILGDQPADKA